MPRIHTADVRAQVLATARNDELAVAAGDNTLISRREQLALAADLSAAADTVRAAAPGETVNIDEVVDVLASQLDSALAAVNQASGSGRAFLSRSEVQNLAAQDPLLGSRVQNAIAVLSGPVLPPPVRGTGAELDAQLRAVLGAFTFDGLLGSEGGEPVSSVLVTTALPQPPTGEALAAALGHDPTTPAGFVERFSAPPTSLLTEFLGQQGSVPAADVAKVGGILNGLTNLRVLVIGSDGAPGVDPVHPTYIVGTATDGTTVGLKTSVVWT